MKKIPKTSIKVAAVLLLFVVFNGENVTFAAEGSAASVEQSVDLTRESWWSLSARYPNPYFSRNENASLPPEVLSNWWQVMQDDTLTQLISLSLKQNKDLEAARARVNEARAALGISRAALLPWLDANGSWSRTHTSDNSPYVGLRGLHTDYKLGIDASWEIDVFGRLKEKVRADSASLQAKHAQLYSSWVTLSSEVAINYISLRTLQERLEIAEAQLALQKNSVDLFGSKRDAGLMNDLPLAQAEYTMQQTRAEIPRLKASIAESLNRLALLTGTVPGGLDNLLLKNRGLPEINPQIYAAIPAEALRQRPDIHAAERKLASQLAKTKSAKADLAPHFSLFGSLGWESSSSGSLLSSGSKGFSIGPQISLPIFHAGAIRRNIKVQSETEKEYLADYENTVLIAVSEVRNALTEVSQEKERKDALQKGAESAKNALEIAQNHYDNGIADYQNVLDAQRSLLSLQEAYTMSRGQELTYMIQLFKAMGGGWAPLENEEIQKSKLSATKSTDTNKEKREGTVK